jgi:octaprenyl-diphosphate synthase
VRTGVQENPSPGENRAAMELDALYAPVEDDLGALGRILRTELSSDDPFIGELVSHVLTTHGKMIRPALVCLSALACGGGSDARLAIAGAVEMIHVASLVHDDVIDTAQTRRGQASVNAVWGNQVAVLLGDYLFSKAFYVLSRLRDTETAATMAWATVRMSQAEIKQIKYGNAPHTNEAIYFDIIEGKTAQLMSAACRCGALTAQAPEAAAATLATFGLEWGMAFQITDDALDLTATPDHLGKPIGSDIQTGKVTLPIIHALARAPAPDQRRLREMLTRTDGEPAAAENGMRELRAILARTGAIDHALGVARSCADRAAAALEGIDRSRARDSLMGLVEFVTARTR